MEAHTRNASFSYLGHFSAPVANSMSSLTLFQAIVLFVCLFWAYSSLQVSRRIRVPGAPVHGYRSWFEPTWVMNLRYAKDAQNIIISGYKKYNLKDLPFVLRRPDHDITILPTRYVAELRTFSNAKLVRSKATFIKWGDAWTVKTLWRHLELPTKAIMENRHGQHTKYLETMTRESGHAVEAEMPRADDWTEADVQKDVPMIVGRMVGKMIIGSQVGRSPQWLDLAQHFTKDIISAAITMRLFPAWMHPLVTNLIPQRWRIRKRLAGAVKITDPYLARYEEATKHRAQDGPEAEEQDVTMMAWMLDNGPDRKYVLDNLPTLMVNLLIPSVHTTAMAISTVLFHLCEHPEWDEKLWKEIADVNSELGPIGERVPVKDWVAKLDLLDSFINESQRFSQPLTISPNRYAVEDFTFNDGLHVPKGSLISWVAVHNQIDPSIEPNPEQFDPTRGYLKRQVSDKEATRHLAGQPSLENLAFGFGSQACPGRTLALWVVKVVLARLIRDYEFRFGEHQGKPKSMQILEFVFPDPDAKLMVRRRRVVD